MGQCCFAPPQFDFKKVRTPGENMAISSVFMTFFPDNNLSSVTLLVYTALPNNRLLLVRSGQHFGCNFR